MRFNKGKTLFFNGLLAIVFAGSFISFQSASAQKEFAFKSFPIMDSTTAYVFDWQVKRIGFFAQEDGLQIQLTRGGQRLCFLISAGGGIIAFADSLQATPIPLEKRNAYSFHEWVEGEKYKVLVSRQTDASGWIRCQWKKVPSGEILDEVWLCSGEADCTVLWSGWRPMGQVLIQKL